MRKMKIFYIMRKSSCMALADMKDFKNILSGDYRWIWVDNNLSCN